MEAQRLAEREADSLYLEVCLEQIRDASAALRQCELTSVTLLVIFFSSLAIFWQSEKFRDTSVVGIDSFGAFLRAYQIGILKFEAYFVLSSMILAMLTSRLRAQARHASSLKDTVHEDVKHIITWIYRRSSISDTKLSSSVFVKLEGSDVLTFFVARLSIYLALFAAFLGFIVLISPLFKGY
jgi:hypothetical protein